MNGLYSLGKINKIMSVIPNNEEHLAAVQQDFLKQLKNYKRKLNPSQRKMLTSIQKISEELSELNMPHVFWCSVESKEKPAFFRFNHFYTKQHDNVFSDEAKEDSWTVLGLITSLVVDFLHRFYLTRVKLQSLVSKDILIDTNPEMEESNGHDNNDDFGSGEDDDENDDLV